MVNGFAFLIGRCVFNPEWTKAQIEMEAIRIYNEANTIDDDDEGCLYCGS